MLISKSLGAKLIQYDLKAQKAHLVTLKQKPSESVGLILKRRMELKVCFL